MNIITVQFDENGNAEVTIPKSPTQGDNLTNRLVAQFDATITNIATVRLHAILPNGQSMSSFQFLIKDISAEVPTFYADLTDYYTQYAGLLKLSVSAQFDGVVQGYDTVIVEDDLDALNALETKDETYAYVTRDTWAVYNWNGSAFVENELLTYDIPVDFQKEFTIYIDEAVTSIGNVSIPLDSYTQLLLMINNTANRVSNVEDSYATKAQSVIIVESLPTLTGGAYDGRYFYLTTDNNVYKIDNETAYKVSNTTYLGTFTTPQNAVNYMVAQMTTQLPSNKLYIASETSGGVMLIMKNNDGGFTVYLNNIRYKYDDAGVFEVEEEYRYNSTLDTYEFKHQDGSWQTMNESWIKVKMTESVLKMQVVRITELQGANNLASKAVLADIQPNIDYDFGITRNDISTNSFDTVIRLGKLDNIATNDWAENDTLYLSDTIPGGITNVAPAVKVIVGFVRKASSTPTATNGSIYIVFKNLPRIATQTSDGLMSSEDKIKLDDLTEPQTTNVLGFKNGEMVRPEYTLTFSEDGWITINGTVTTFERVDIASFLNINVKTNTNYTTSFEVIDGTKSSANFQLVGVSNTWVVFINIFSGTNGYFTATMGTLIPTIWYLQVYAATYNNYKFRLWMNEGNIALNYNSYYQFSIPNLDINDQANIIKQISINSELPLNNFLLTAGHTPLATWVDDDTASLTAVNSVKTICDSLGIKATFACITSNLDNVTGMTEELLNLQKEGFHITNHSHSHGPWYTGTLFTLAEAEEDLITAILKLRENNFLDSNFFVYPGGSFNIAGIPDIINKWCIAGITPIGDYNHLYGDGRNFIHRLFITSSNALSYYTSIIDTAYTNGDWIIFGTHSNNPSEFDAELVEDVLSYAISKGIEIKTLNEAYKQRKGNYDIYELFK